MDSRVSQLITAAEQHIASQEYSAAMEQLFAAEQIEPNNKSIELIRELVRLLQVENDKPSVLRRLFTSLTDPFTKENVGKNTNNQEDGVRARVRVFTTQAAQFLARDEVDSAFEALMRAYLLDPVAPEVLDCEQRVLPAWRRLHGSSEGTAHQLWSIRRGVPERRAQSTFLERLKAGKVLR